MHPDDPNVVFVAAIGHLWGPNEERGLYKSTDGGATWRRGLYKSTDCGETWTKLTNAGLANSLPTGDIGRVGITVYRKDPRILYVRLEQGERSNASTQYQ